MSGPRPVRRPFFPVPAGGRSPDAEGMPFSGGHALCDEAARWIGKRGTTQRMRFRAVAERGRAALHSDRNIRKVSDMRRTLFLVSASLGELFRAEEWRCRSARCSGPFRFLSVGFSPSGSSRSSAGRTKCRKMQGDFARTAEAIRRGRRGVRTRRMPEGGRFFFFVRFAGGSGRAASRSPCGFGSFESVAGAVCRKTVGRTGKTRGIAGPFLPFADDCGVKNEKEDVRFRQTSSFLSEFDGRITSYRPYRPCPAAWLPELRVLSC